MHVFTNKCFMSFKNSFSVLSQLCRGKGWKMLSHLKGLCWQHDIVPQATCCPWAMGWESLLSLVMLTGKVWKIYKKHTKFNQWISIYWTSEGKYSLTLNEVISITVKKSSSSMTSVNNCDEIFFFTGLDKGNVYTHTNVDQYQFKITFENTDIRNTHWKS
jgi:hypothetical protein